MGEVVCVAASAAVTACQGCCGEELSFIDSEIYVTSLPWECVSLIDHPGSRTVRNWRSERLARGAPSTIDEGISAEQMLQSLSATEADIGNRGEEDSREEDSREEDSRGEAEVRRYGGWRINSEGSRVHVTQPRLDSRPPSYQSLWLQSEELPPPAYRSLFPQPQESLPAPSQTHSLTTSEDSLSPAALMQMLQPEEDYGSPRPLAHSEIARIHT